MFSVRLSNHRANAKNKKFLATAILSGKTLGVRKGFSVELYNSKKAKWERNLSDIMIQYGRLLILETLYINQSSIDEEFYPF